MIPLLDLALAEKPETRPALLKQLYDAAFDVGFLYIKNHGVEASTILDLADRLPALFDLPTETKLGLSKMNCSHFLGYNGLSEETTLGIQDLREQFDFATELPAIWEDLNKPGDKMIPLYWRLRGPNQWPPLAGFKEALAAYHDSLAQLSYRFVHLIEEAFGISKGELYDRFFDPLNKEILSPQHRMKLLKYPKSLADGDGQGVGPHKDSSGWLTFLYQVNNEPGLEVLNKDGTWIAASPIDGTFVVNFGNAFESATEGAVRATTHQVKAPKTKDRYSIPFFMGLPLDLTVAEIRDSFPASIRQLRHDSDPSAAEKAISTFLDPRWDVLGESQLRKWIRSHPDCGRKWYGNNVVEYYLQ